MPTMFGRACFHSLTVLVDLLILINVNSIRQLCDFINFKMEDFEFHDIYRNVRFLNVNLPFAVRRFKVQLFFLS